jgi:phosphohistidine phosphatase
MKSLFILRHAKALADAPDGQDISRALSDRGKRDAERVGKTLRKLELIPDLILCSPAVRTRETLEAVLDKLRTPQPIATNFDDAIYDATGGALVHVIRHVESSDSVLLVGHNPGLEELLARLISPNGGVHIPLSTASLAAIEFPIDDWDDVVEQAGELLFLAHPDLLRAL